MNLNLSNKTFLISGSSKGIGLKIAETLLSEGANVIITGRSKNLIKNQFNKLYSKFRLKVAYTNGDIKSNFVLKKIKNLVKKRWKKLDGIIANAGSVKMNISSFSSEKDFYHISELTRWILDVNSALKRYDALLYFKTKIYNFILKKLKKFQWGIF